MTTINLPLEGEKAGNTTRVQARYRVIYRFDGFLQPIDDIIPTPSRSSS
jgi:hypothetical protein